MGFNERDMVGHSGPKPEDVQLAKLREALSRVEAATGPDQEIDEAVALLTGWEKRPATVLPWWENEIANIGQGAPPAVTGSLEAVVALVEQEMPEAWWEGNSLGDMELMISSPRRRQLGAASCATPALALLAAYLRARIAEAEQS